MKGEGCDKLLETCLSFGRCQVNAIQVENDLAVINRDRYIGCGLCASTCPTESIPLYHKQPDAVSEVFSDQNELMQAIAKDTNKEFPFE